MGVFDIAIWELSLLGVLLLAFMYQVYFYVRYMHLKAQSRKEEGESQKTAALKEESQKILPPVSVIVCARNEGYNLKAYVQSLLTQDYPVYEVIIVNDGSEDNTQAVIDEYAVLDNRVHTTFVPVGARVRSTKKLGLTLAAKSAQYDYLLLTDADCRPESTQWIRSMMAGFGAGDQVEVVLGYGAYFQESTLLNDVIQYETLFNGVHYLGAAATGKPYMGVGRNLAYRKDTFFSHGGFTDLMTERAGDDDLFVNKIATKRNTVAVTDKESVTWSVPKQTWKTWWQQKRRHLSVSGCYCAKSKRHLVREPMTRGIFYLLTIILLAIGSPLVMTAAFVMLMIRLLLQLIMLNIAANHLGQHSMGLEILWYDMILPLITALALILPKYKDRW